MFRAIEMNEKKLETVNYRELCKAIIQELHEIERNWRTGNYKIITEKWYSDRFLHVVVGRDWIAKLDNYYSAGGVKNITFHSRTSMVCQSFISIPDGSSAVTNTEIVVEWDEKNIKILGINGRLISEVPELDEDERVSWKLTSCCITNDQMAVISRTERQDKLSLWDVSDPFRVTRLNSRHFSVGLPFGFDLSMKMDDQFIAVSTFQYKTANFYFFSKNTLDLHWQKTVDGYMEEKLAVLY